MNDAIGIFSQAIIGRFEDGGVGVGIDGDQRLRLSYTGQVLYGARYAKGDVDVGGYRLARLADL